MSRDAIKVDIMSASDNRSEAKDGAAASHCLRTGADYLRSLRDGRQVFVEGESVADVTQHKAFREAARSIARLYDIAGDPENRARMTFPSPATGAPVLRAYQIPKNHTDLRARRLFSEKWAEATFGLMGRTPDHVAGFFCGYAAVPEVFARAGQQFADNVVKFYEHLRDNHLYASYAIVPPQIDRSKPAHKQSDPTLYAGVVKERDDGIVISGAQQLATGGVLSDFIHLSCIHPLQPGDENYANCVAIPVNAPGVKLYPRRPFALRATNSFDYPLSSRFDESDSYVVFDNVFVPWERVFIYRNIEASRDQWWKTPSHLYGNHQAQVRYATKLRFMIGLAKRMNEMTGNEANPSVQTVMGELAAFVSIVESMLLAHETVAPIENGVLWPSKMTLYSVMALQSEFNGRMLETIRELAGAAMITQPSSLKDFENPEIARDIARYMGSATSDARSRTQFMRLAWDFIGSEFGSRHAQYEKFYGGASFVVKQNVYRNYDFKRATALVDAALNLPEVEES
ncbi:MAG TPA: 4-hydroxyphenylacetate 3-hydroxylase N-terminal domain-containing protein [Xanthobacteraceae bacterium]|jgi:4-hydroxyphenylacetate 3-monooxygenase|nr:4-hydroxyphenylacetate 3-hydroxylase N-terminal domain-containing protein [Xanthobacteraceae bacterium]